ncbi:ribosomal protein S18-alanine N-acetyltransferase [bacterium]|nr:ribosomal protein S18-alanine N-acetyltransferase [bacterium]
MLLDFGLLSKFAAEISALGDADFHGETSLFIEDIINKNADHKVFAAFHEEKAVGFLILSTVLDEAEILEVAVSENLRRNGIGSELMTEVFGWCEKNGIAQIFLEVRESNLPALNCYGKFGFVENGVRKNYYRNPSENAVLMSKKVSVVF